MKVKTSVFVFLITVLTTTLYAGNYERSEYSKYDNFRNRINYSMQYAAIAIKSESPENISNWQSSTVYNIDDFVIPSTANGYSYKCTVYGTTGVIEPTWPTTLTNTVVDGDVTWECVNPPTPHHNLRTAFADVVLRNGYNQNSISMAIATNATIGTEIDLIMTAPIWEASTAYILTDSVTATTVNSFRYVCTTAGTSGSTEPAWSMIPSETVNDGTVVWTCDGPLDSDIQFVVNSFWNAFSGVNSD